MTRIFITNERRKQIKYWQCNDKDLYHKLLSVEFLRSMVYFLSKIEMRSGDLDKDTQVKHIDEKLSMKSQLLPRSTVIVLKNHAFEDLYAMLDISFSALSRSHFKLS